MKLELNEEKSPFCTIGPFAWTFGSKEHEVNVDELPGEYRKQILYNINRGVLLTNDKEGLRALAGAMQPSTPIPAEQIPIKHQDVAKKAQSLIKDPMKEDLKPLKALLRQTVATVKKEAAAMSASKVRKLLELEKETKNRKSITTFLIAKLEKHELAVMEAVGIEEEELFFAVDPLARSTQVSDIVESEEEIVVLNPDTIQKAKEAQESEAILMGQEVLFQIEEE